MEARSSKDVVLPIAEARALRDELAHLLADNYRLLNTSTVAVAAPVQVEIIGGKF